MSDESIINFKDNSKVILGEYKNFSIKLEEVMVDSKEIEDHYSSLLDKYCDKVIADSNYSVELSDLVTISFDVYDHDAQHLDKLSAKEVVINMKGQEVLLPEVKSGLYGRRVGHEFEIEVVAPNSFSIKKYKNTKLNFKIKIIKIEKQILNEQKVFEKLNCSNILAAKEKIFADLKNSKIANEKNRVFDIIMDKIAENAQYSLPTDMINKFIMSKLDDIKKESKNIIKDEEKLIGIIESQMSKEVRNTILLKAVFDAERLSVDAEEIGEVLKQKGYSLDELTKDKLNKIRIMQEMEKTKNFLITSNLVLK